MVFALTKPVLKICIMNKLLAVILFCLVFSLGNAQIDRSNNSFAIPAEDVKDTKADNSLKIKPSKKASNEVKKDDSSDEDFISNEVYKPKPLPKKKAEQFTLIEKNKFKNPAQQFTKSLKRQLKLEEDRERKNNGSTVNQFLGQYSTSAKIVNIIYRDHGAQDGDMIRVYVNEKIVVSRVMLTNQVNGLNLVLDQGINKIDFYALNQGSAGPNTAEFRILDEKGDVISANQWNLATGVKATVILLKEDESVKLKSK